MIDYDSTRISREQGDHGSYPLAFDPFSLPLNWLA